MSTAPLPAGNALLVGVGGSGRKSLSRLAAFVAELKCFTIEISKNYRQTEFREDLKNLYRQAGCQNKPTLFLFDETQIKMESFLEDVNNILSSGEVRHEPGPAPGCCAALRHLQSWRACTAAASRNMLEYIPRGRHLYKHATESRARQSLV